MLQLANQDNSFQLLVDTAKAQARLAVAPPGQGFDLKVAVPLAPDAQALALSWHEAVQQAGGEPPPAVRGRLVRIEGRARLALTYLVPPLREMVEWLIRSKEETNFTYGLVDRSRAYLAHTLAAVTGRPAAEMRGYVDEPESDEALMTYLKTRVGAFAASAIDEEARFGRRLGWYAVVRAKKPQVVVETGVDKGLGSVLLCAALLRNAAEGHPGTYFGTDINPAAGALFGPPYSDTGRILYGDSIESLKALGRPIDVFINDSDHSAEYEAREYETVTSMLSGGAVVLGDNAHVTDKLCRFAETTGRRFLFFGEKPERHWYPGAGIGFAF